MKTFDYKKGSLILLSGIPGCGKSTFAKTHFPKDYIISTDEIRERYFGEEYKFFENGEFGIGNFESNGAFIFEMVMKIAKQRCEEGLTTVIDAMNLKDSDRKKFIDLGNWSKIYTLIFPTTKAFEQNEKRKATKGYIPQKVLEKKILSFQKRTTIKGNTIVYADEIEKVQEKFEQLSLEEKNNILIFGDIHGIKNFYQNYKYLQEKYTKNGQKPMNIFMGDLVDRGDLSVDNLCFVMSETKKGNARMIMGNHDLKLLRNIKNFLETGKIEDFVEARYKTIKDFVELHKKDGIYNGCIEEIQGENFNLHKVKNFLENLPFYKKIITNSDRQYIITHGPILIPENFGNLKKSQCIFGSEQLKENLRVNREQADENNTNFIKVATKLFQKNGKTCVFGHVDLQKYINENNAKGMHSLEGSVDTGGVMKVLVLEKNGDEIIETIETFDSGLNYSRGQSETGEYKNFANMDTKLMYRRELGDLTIFKYARNVFYDNSWLKNSDEENKRLLQARGIVFDRLGNVISYPFDKVFNYGEILKNRNGDIVTENKLPDGKYQFVEKLNGFLGIISQDFYNRNGFLIHTSGSLESPFNEYIRDLLTDEQKINITKFFKTKGKHTLMFEVIHPSDPHIISYGDSDFGLYLIGARNLQAENLDSMELLSEKELDELAKNLGLRRPKYFEEDFEDFKKRITKEKIEGYMVRNLKTGKHLVKIKFPYYLVTKFLARMGENNLKFLFSNKQKFLESKNIDEEFFPLVEYIYENKEEFLGLDELGRVVKIREFLENNF
ncbi:metallophosphoesterase [Candidatus Gracilibacteria bacterium]|nr:metallophosphoesterase [Candidatus Gracilibacteria bacterium]